MSFVSPERAATAITENPYARLARIAPRGFTVSPEALT
jgi:hypothetical protein